MWIVKAFRQHKEEENFVGLLKVDSAGEFCYTLSMEWSRWIERLINSVTKFKSFKIIQKHEQKPDKEKFPRLISFEIFLCSGNVFRRYSIMAESFKNRQA